MVVEHTPMIRNAAPRRGAAAESSPAAAASDDDFKPPAAVRSALGEAPLLESIPERDSTAKSRRR
eukprot:5286963-Pyramimonas_sp.AAC.1